MRILLLIQYYFPNTQSCAQLMRDLAEELRDLGHKVILVAPDDSLADGRTIADEEGVTVVRVPSPPFRGTSRPMRAWNEWRLPATVWRGAGDFLRAHPCELIVSYSPPILFAPLVRRLKRLWGCPNYLVLRDIFPKWAVDAGVIRAGGPAHRLFRRYERALYATADTIGVMSERNLDYFAAEGPEVGCRVEVLYNWARSRGQTIAPTRYRQELGLEDRVVFLYGGNLGVAQDPAMIVRLAAAFGDEPRPFFLLVGDGSEAGALKAEAERLGLDNLRFLPPVDHATYLGMVSEFDVGLITLNRSLETHNFPSKMHDFMYCRKPILAALNPGNDLRPLLERSDAGLVCWSGDDEELGARARRLSADTDLRRRLGENGRTILETLFSPARAAGQILALAGRDPRSGAA